MSMNQTQTIESSGSVGLMARVSWPRFARRLTVGLVAMFISFGAVYWGSALMLGEQQKARYTWTSDLQFLFSGVTRGEYPNGMAFSASDLVSDVVLARALERVDQPDLALDVDTLSTQLSVTSYLPRLSQLRREYAQRLNDELTQVEVEELEQAYLNELQRGVQRQAQLILTADDPEFPGEAILRAIPQAWAEYVTDQLKTFSTDRMLYSARLIDEGIFNEADFVSAYNLILDQLRLLRHNLMVLDAEPNSGLVRDPDSGRRLSDIRARADQLEAVYLDNLLSQVIGLGLTRNPEQTLAFIEARSAELERRANLLNQQSQAIDEALQGYGRNDGDRDDGVGRAGSGDAFLDRLVSLGMESGDLEFRQTLTRDRLAIDLEATSVQSELRRLQGLTESVSGLSGQGGVPDADNVAVIEAVSKALEDIIVDIEAMFGATNGIAEQMDRLQFGDGSSLFRVNSLSGQPAEVSRLFTAGSVYWFWVLTVALALVVLVWVIGREMLDIIAHRRREA
jgi:hypothetical protein